MYWPAARRHVRAVMYEYYQNLENREKMYAAAVRAIELSNTRPFRRDMRAKAARRYRARMSAQRYHFTFRLYHILRAVCIFADREKVFVILRVDTWKAI